MDILLVVYFLLEWAAARRDYVQSTDFDSIGRTLLQLVTQCNFPAPLRELYEWGHVLCHLQDLLRVPNPDAATILLLCQHTYPVSTPGPEPLHSLIRSDTVTRTLTVLYDLNALTYNFFEFNMPGDATTPPLHRNVVEPLQTLRWWLSTMLFILTDSPPSSGTDSEHNDTALQDTGSLDAGGEETSAVVTNG